MFTMSASAIFFAFIAIATLAIAVDGVLVALQCAMKRVPLLPDQLEHSIAYILLVSMGSFICWEGHFDLFTLLGFQWRDQEMGWVLTGAIIAGGSPLLKKQFKMIGLIPSAISGMASTFGLGGSTDDVEDVISTPESDQAGPL